MNRKTFRLYPQPSFWEGLARLHDWFGLLDQYNYSSTNEMADYRAIESDWEEISNDLRDAIRKFESEHKKQLAK